MVGRVIKDKDGNLSMERISGLTSQDFQGSTTLTCTVSGECAFYLTGGNMSTNINIGRGNDLGKAKYCDRNTGVITLGTGNVLLNDNLASTSWDVGVLIGNCHCVQSDTWSFGYGNKSYAPSDHAILGYNEMIGYDLRIGNVNNTVWTHSFMTLVGNSIWIDHENFQAGMGANDLGCATHHSNTSTVVGRNIHLNHRYSSNPGRNEVVSSWGGRFCMTDSGVFGRGNVVWYKTSDNPHTGVVAVHAPHACMTNTNTYSGNTATCPIPNDQLRGATNAFIFGGYNRLFADRGIIVGYNNTTDTYCAPLSTTGVSAVPVNCIATNNVMVSYDSYAYGRDNVNIGRNNVVAGDRNYVMGTDATVLGNYSVAIGTQARVLRTGQAVTRPTMNIMTGAHPNDYSVAIGPNVWAGQRGSIALGNNACTINPGSTGAENSVAIGTIAYVSGNVGVAIGNDSRSTGVGAVALGSGTRSTSAYSIAIGINSLAQGAEGNIAIGVNAKACSTSGGSVVIGNGAFSCASHSGDRSIAIGGGACSVAHTGIALGYGAYNGPLLNYTSCAYNVEGYGSRSTAIGYLAKTCAYNSIAIGDETCVRGPNGIAIGHNAIAGWASGTDYPDSAIAIGNLARACCHQAISIGRTAWSGQSAIAIGEMACARDWGQIAIGRCATTPGVWATQAFGDFTENQRNVARACWNYDTSQGLAMSRIVKAMHGFEFTGLWWTQVRQNYWWHFLQGVELFVSNLPVNWNGATNDANLWSRFLFLFWGGDANGNQYCTSRWAGTSSINATTLQNSCQYISDWFTAGNNTNLGATPDRSNFFKIYIAANGTN